MLGRKLGRLPDEAGHLLEVVAVSGQALSLEEASRTAGHASPPMSTITRMRTRASSASLVPRRGRWSIPTTTGSGKRSSAGSSRRLARPFIARSRRSSKHRWRAAPDELERSLESWENDREREERASPASTTWPIISTLPVERRKAWIYALLAGEQARRQAALEVAANNFAIARRNAEGTRSAVRYRISEGQGGVLTLLGRYEDAARQLAGTIELAEDPERKARIEALQGEILFKQGSMDGSIALYENGLRRLGYWVPRTTLGFGCGVLRELVSQCLHSLRPGSLHRKPSSSELDLAVRLLARTTHTYAFQNTLKMVRAHLTGMNLAELHFPTKDLAFTYAFHDCMMSMLGWRERGTRYGDRAIVLAREFDDIWTQGQSCNYKGIALYASAHYEEGVVRLGEAIDHFEKAGDLCELNLAHFHKGCCQFGLGNLAEAVAEARKAFAASVRVGDSRTLCSSYLWAQPCAETSPSRSSRAVIQIGRMTSCPRSTASWRKATGTRSTAAPRSARDL